MYRQPIIITLLLLLTTSCFAQNVDSLILAAESLKGSSKAKACKRVQFSPGQALYSYITLVQVFTYQSDGIDIGIGVHVWHVSQGFMDQKVLFCVVSRFLHRVA